MTTPRKGPGFYPRNMAWQRVVNRITLVQSRAVHHNLDVFQLTDLNTKIEKHVFVVTYGRSGSTLVQKLLNSIDGACIRGENSNALAGVTQAWQMTRGPNSLARRAAQKSTTTPDAPWYGRENFNLQRYGRALADVFTREVLAPPPGTRIAGFKEIRWAYAEPAFSQILNFAHEFFADSHFIFNTREHDQVAQSGWWADKDPADVRKRLLAQDALFDAYLRTFPDRGVRIHYNDYITDHEALRPMFDHISEPFDADTISTIMRQKLMHLKPENLA